ncbi:hypothetical protein Lal_00039779 [Lupinus albus]|nr:hypothetical protein Lal_00039779 [Lupinus albus]
MQQMWNVRGSQSPLPYAIFITKILEHFGVSLDGETKTPPYLGECWVGFLVTALVPPTPSPTLGSFPFPPYNTMLVNPHKCVCGPLFNVTASGSRLSEPFLAQARKSRPFQKLRFDPLAQARDSHSSENLTFLTDPKCHFSPRRDNSRSGENPLHRTDRPTAPTAQPEPTIPNPPEFHDQSSSPAAMPSNQMIIDELVSLGGYITNWMDALDTQNQQIQYELHHLSSRLNNMDVDEDSSEPEHITPNERGSIQDRESILKTCQEISQNMLLSEN